MGKGAQVGVVMGGQGNMALNLLHMFSMANGMQAEQAHITTRWGKGQRWQGGRQKGERQQQGTR